MEQKKVDVMWALTVRWNVIDRITFVFGIGQNDIYTNFRILGFEFGKVTQLDKEENTFEIESSVVTDVAGHAVGVWLGWMQRWQ